jgi:outer membrane receptor protein involved in Fe transport
MRPSHALVAAAVLAVGGTAYAQSTASPTTNPSEQTKIELPSATPALPSITTPAAPAPAPLASSPPAPSTTEITAVPSTQPFVPSTQPTAGQTPVPNGQLGRILVTSDLDATRDFIAPSLGAGTYTIGPKQIEETPEGEDAPFQQVLLRAPGVVEDSFGQVHIRGEHANLTYRVNGVLLPEGLNGFGQELDSRLIQSVTLIDGSLPAEFGFRTAGIVDVKTKSGESLDHNELSLYGGSQNTFEPSVEFGGVDGKLDYFVTGSGLHNDLGIENTASSSQAIHDRTNQERLFTYLSYHIDDTSRISLLLNASNSDFQIPNTPGFPATFPIAGHPNALSANSVSVDENQNEQQYYSVLSYQKSIDKLSFQASVFTRYGQIDFEPDWENDLVFQGVAGEVFNSFFTNGVQFDSSYVLNDQHTVRAGFIGDFTAERLETNTTVFATDPLTGLIASDVPSNIPDNSGNHGVSAGIYIQDEWQLNKAFTLNYGARYDRFDTNFTDAGQLSPRVNLVWKVDDKTTAHFGYARYFVPPPLQFVPPASLSKFANTTNAPENFGDDAPKVERSHYFDMGVSRQITKPWLVNLDGFYKMANNLVDNGQFGDAVIITPFNYRVGFVYGAELSTTYNVGGLSAFGNFSWVIARGKDINSNQFLFGNDELTYIKNTYIRLDHEGNYTGSVGVSYTWTNDRVYVDALYGSGLRAGFANLQKEPEYAPVNVGYEHVFHPNGLGRNTVKLRFDILNVLDESYQLRNGTGLGVEAPQYGQRRTYLVGLAYTF